MNINEHGSKHPYVRISKETNQKQKELNEQANKKQQKK